MVPKFVKIGINKAKETFKMIRMARPKRIPETKSIPVGFRLDEADRPIMEALERFALDRRLSRNAAVTNLVELALVSAGYLAQARKSN